MQADYEMALIFHELLNGNAVCNEDLSKNWSFSLDQMARTEQRIPSVLKSVDALKRSIAKAALLNRIESEEKGTQLLLKPSIQPDILRIAEHGPNFPDTRDEQLVRMVFSVVGALIKTGRIQDIVDDCQPGTT